MTPHQAHQFNNRDIKIATAIRDALVRPENKAPKGQSLESRIEGVLVIDEYSVPVRRFAGYVVPICGKLGDVVRWVK